MLVLGVILGSAIVLYKWSRDDDPRFYAFLKTRPGQFLSRVFRWRGAWSAVPMVEKTEQQMSSEELVTKRALEEELRAEFPTHELTFNTGQKVRGWVREEKPAYVVFAESYRQSGGVSIQVRRERIERLVPLTNAIPPVTYRDVRLKMEFPAFGFYRRRPYAILTDESYFGVEHSVRALQEMYRQFVQAFGELITNLARSQDIQVLFFSKEAQYRSYQDRYAPDMQASSGFYSPLIDRLVVYNQATSDQITRAFAGLEEEAAKFRDLAASDASAAAQLAAWKKDTERRIRNFAENQTLSTIRHEGAHQLFYTCGVHSENRMENEWLVEGLATYCETQRLGDKDPVRAASIKRALSGNSLIPLEEIVSFRDPRGLMSFGPQERVELAYAESWALVHFLMQDDRRSAFFDYIRYLRTPANFRDVRKARPLDLLCQFLGMGPEEVSKAWADYLAGL